METAASSGYPPAPRSSRAMYWGGWALSIVPLLMLTMGGIMAVMRTPQAVQGMVKYGYPAGAALWIGISALLSVVLYLIPRTAMLGTIIATGYLGGAVSTHVRAGEPFILPIACAVLLWLGLWMREHRLRALTPVSR